LANFLLQDILSDGGCKWGKQVISNGAVWQPRVLPNGGECISCSCKVSKSIQILFAKMLI